MWYNKTIERGDTNMRLYIGQSISPVEYGQNYLIESRTKLGAINRIKKHGREVIRVKRITEQKADEMMVNGKIFACYNV